MTDAAWTKYFDCVYRRNDEIYKPLTYIDQPAITLRNVETGERHVAMIAHHLITEHDFDPDDIANAPLIDHSEQP